MDQFLIFPSTDHHHREEGCKSVSRTPRPAHKSDQDFFSYWYRLAKRTHVFLAWPCLKHIWPTRAADWSPRHWWTKRSQLLSHRAVTQQQVQPIYLNTLDIKQPGQNFVLKTGWKHELCLKGCVSFQLKYAFVLLHDTWCFISDRTGSYADKSVCYSAVPRRSELRPESWISVERTERQEFRQMAVVLQIMAIMFSKMLKWTDFCRRLSPKDLK